MACGIFDCRRKIAQGKTMNGFGSILSLAQTRVSLRVVNHIIAKDYWSGCNNQTISVSRNCRCQVILYALPVRRQQDYGVKIITMTMKRPDNDMKG